MRAFPGRAMTARRAAAARQVGYGRGGARPRHSQVRHCAWLGLLAWLILALIPARALDQSLPFIRLPLTVTIPDVEDPVKLSGQWGDGNDQRVIIGQIEDFHPARLTHPMLNNVPFAFRPLDPENPNVIHVSDHATHVAGILVGNEHTAVYDGNERTLQGVAPNAALQSSGWKGGAERKGDFQAAMNWFMSTQDKYNAHIINMSAGVRAKNIVPVFENDKLLGYRVGTAEEWQNVWFGGTDHSGDINRTADWVVSKHNTLFVVAAGNEGTLQGAEGHTLMFPSSAYNVLAVGATGSGAKDSDFYRRLWPHSSEGQKGDRPIKPHLVAPGGNILSANYPHSPPDTFIEMSGTSMAAPHVAGTAALLHEYGRRQIESGGWPYSCLHPQVMRAVLMNSADKNVFGKDGQSWLKREAAQGATIDGKPIPANRIPLDSQLGTGLLDARQALAQYEAGQHGPGYIPLAGWDYNSLPAVPMITGPAGEPVRDPAGVYKNYYFEDPVEAGMHRLTATLVWDRQVKDDLTDYLFPLENLDLVLYYDPPDWPGRKVIQLFELSSVSYNSNIEHLSHKLNAGGFYTLEVKRWAGGNAGDALPINYAFAWAFAPEPGTGLILVVLAIFVLGRRRTFGRGAC